MGATVDASTPGAAAGRSDEGSAAVSGTLLAVVGTFVVAAGGTGTAGAAGASEAEAATGALLVAGAIELEGASAGCFANDSLADAEGGTAFVVVRIGGRGCSAGGSGTRSAIAGAVGAAL